jgi:hypothetical protein
MPWDKETVAKAPLKPGEINLTRAPPLVRGAKRQGMQPLDWTDRLCQLCSSIIFVRSLVSLLHDAVEHHHTQSGRMYRGGRSIMHLHLLLLLPRPPLRIAGGRRGSHMAKVRLARFALLSIICRAEQLKSRCCFGLNCCQPNMKTN